MGVRRFIPERTAVTVGVSNFPPDDRITVEISRPIIKERNAGTEWTERRARRGVSPFQNYDLNCVQIDNSGDCSLVAIDRSYKTGSGVATFIFFSTYGL